MNYNKLPIIIKNTINYNIQRLLNYKFYNVENKSFTYDNSINKNLIYNSKYIQINDF